MRLRCLNEAPYGFLLGYYEPELNFGGAEMDIYFEMAKHPVFTIEDVNLFYDNMNSARSAVKRMLAASKVQKIRNNLYTCISAENGSPVANRFQIASAISKTSYVSHH